MREKKTSLEDIAKAIGVSKATVSFVLNGRGDEFNISKEKQRIIKEKAVELAYVPNFFAKSLRQGQTKTIGVVLADITNPFYAELCKTIQEELYSRGYSTLIVNTNDNKEQEKILMRELIQRSIDGMIISPCNTIDALIPILEDTHIPVVFADRPGDDHADFVGIDNTKEAQKLIHHFSVRPKRIVALTQYAELVDSIQNRISGAKKVCESENIPFEAVHLPESEKETNEIIMSHLKKGTDAFLPLNNPVTFKLVATFKNYGVKIPDQVRIISFDDHIAFSYMDPPISALKQPVHHIGVESVERLVDRLKETKVPGKQLLLSCEFVARGSH